MEGQPHILAVPYPAQGHVTPLMKLSYKMADEGIKVTFVITESKYAQVVAASQEKDDENSSIRLVSVPDGTLMPDDDSQKAMLGHLKDLIEKINSSANEKPITCIVADALIGWTLKIAEHFGLKQFPFWPAGPGSLALIQHIPKLIEGGVIDMNGCTMRNEMIKLSEEVPAWSGNELFWILPCHPIEYSKVCFELCSLAVKGTVDRADWILCNTFYELDSSACDLIPNILPVGPLFSSDHSKFSSGSFWTKDSGCLSWLDGQLAKSVLYVAFGSLAQFSQHQLDELALGLELSGQPFLWVIRSDFIKGSDIEYPDGFLRRVGDRGKIVGWAPQEEVLAHPSTSCFLTHCGWNSVMEGLSIGGIPFLCWPYYCDQFHNRNYICDTWKVGLKLEQDENGIVSRHEVKKKIDNLLSDDRFRSNAMKLKEMGRSANKWGSSYRNFERFISHLKH